MGIKLHFVKSVKHLLTIVIFFLAISVCLAQKQPKTNRIAKLMMARIRALPEVQEFFRGCPKSYKPALIIEAEPDLKSRFYWIKVGMSNFDMFRTNFNFYIDPGTNKIYYWDQLNEMDNPIITLTQWRYWRTKPGFKKPHVYKNGKLIVSKV